MVSFQGKKPQVFYSTGDTGGNITIKSSSNTLTETIQTRFARQLDSEYKGLVLLFAQMCAGIKKPGFGADETKRNAELASLRNDLQDILQQAAFENRKCRFATSIKNAGEPPVFSVLFVAKGLSIHAAISSSTATPLLKISIKTDCPETTRETTVSPITTGSLSKHVGIDPRFLNEMENAALMLMNHEPEFVPKKELDAKHVEQVDLLLSLLREIEGKNVSRVKFKGYFDELVKIVKGAAEGNELFKFKFEETGRPSFSELSPDDGKYSLLISGKGPGENVQMSLSLIRDYKRTRLDESFSSNLGSSSAMYPRMLSEDLFRKGIIETMEDLLNFDGMTLDNMSHKW